MLVGVILLLLIQVFVGIIQVNNKEVSILLNKTWAYAGGYYIHPLFRVLVEP